MLFWMGSLLVSAKQYLLPCPCGRHISVEPRQAGEPILCECGASLVVPTLLDMRMLEPALEPTGPSSVKDVWGPSQQVRLVGLVVLALSLIGGALLYKFWPASPTIDATFIQETASRFTPVQTWDVWRQTTDQGLDRRTDQGYEESVSIFRFLLASVGILFLVGASLAAVGTWLRMKRR